MTTAVTLHLSEAQGFFYDHAGYGYIPAAETAEQGRLRTALSLAAAESQAAAWGYTYEWCYDLEIDSSDFTDEQPPWDLWECLIWDPSGTVAGSLGGIDLGRDGHPDTDPYARVVQAELADEHAVPNPATVRAHREPATR